MTTVQEDYALARAVAIECDSQRTDVPLYLNAFSMYRFRNEGISNEDFARLVKTETNYVASLTNALEQMLEELMCDVQCHY